MHPRTNTKLSKFKITPESITQQQNKRKFYTDSKADDRALQWGIIKRHILPKKCSQRYEIKILSSKRYDKVNLQDLL